MSLEAPKRLTNRKLVLSALAGIGLAALVAALTSHKPQTPAIHKYVVNDGEGNIDVYEVQNPRKVLGSIYGDSDNAFMPCLKDRSVEKALYSDIDGQHPVVWYKTTVGAKYNVIGPFTVFGYSFPGWEGDFEQPGWIGYANVGFHRVSDKIVSLVAQQKGEQEPPAQTYGSYRFLAVPEVRDASTRIACEEQALGQECSRIAAAEQKQEDCKNAK